MVAEGFDPLAEIDELLLGGPAGKRNDALVLMRFRCAPGRLSSLSPKSQPGVFSSYGGARILTFESEGKPVSAACLGPTMLAAGNPGKVKAALTRRAAPRGPDLALSERAAAMRGAHDIWLVARADFGQIKPEVPNEKAAALMKSEMVKSIQQVAAGVKLSPGLAISVDLTTKTGNDAEMIAGALLMMAGMAKSDPKQGKNVARVLDNLSVRAEGNQMQASLKLSDQQLAELQSQVKAAAAPPPTEIMIYSSPKDMGTVKLPPPK